jgi:large conductance mechanosensitive channel
MAHFFNLKGFLEEFKAFALKGNVIDLAVAVVIGGAFNKIVSVFVSSIITRYLTSGVNLAYLVLKLGDVELKYGELLQATIDFLIIAFSVFVAIKLIGALRRKSEEAPAAPAPKPDDVVLLEQIRDILQKQADAK